MTEERERETALIEQKKSILTANRVDTIQFCLEIIPLGLQEQDKDKDKNKDKKHKKGRNTKEDRETTKDRCTRIDSV